MAKSKVDKVVTRLPENGVLKIDPRNVRVHGRENKKRIKQSLEAIGAGRGILADGENIIRAGNGIYEQAKKLGFKFKIVDVDDKTILVSRRPDLRGKRAVRAAMLDNLASDSSAYDYDADILADVVNNDALLKSIAADDERLQELLGIEDETPNDDEHAAALVDKAAELQKKWKVKLGDLWELGEHLILCGDCTKIDDWRKLLQAAKVEKVNGVFTSPPYAMQRKKQYGGVATDKYVDWWYDVQANVRKHLTEDGSFFVNIKPHCENGERVLYVFDLVLAMQRKWAWRFVDEFSWLRPALPGVWNNRFKNGFEPVYHFSADLKIKFNPKSVSIKSNSTFEYGEAFGQTATGSGAFKYANRHDGLAYPDNVLEIRATADNIPHSAQFPIALPEFFIKAYSDEDGIWLDPFLGSGTTICAAHKNGRRGLGIEKLEKYVAVCLERISDLTGKKPKRL